MANANGNGNNGNEERYLQASIPRLDGQHYEHWSLLMENFLRSKEYWYLIENGIPKPAPGTTVTEAEQKKIDESKLKDLKCKNYLFQAIDRVTVEQILRKDTSKEIWQSLTEKFQGNARVRKAILQGAKKEFEHLEMKANETISEYLPKVMEIANKMRIHGEDVQDRVIVEKILRSLTEKYNYIVCSIAESKDIETMSVLELRSSLIVHEQNYLRFNKSRGLEQVLKTIVQERGSHTAANRGRGGTRGRGRGRQSRDTIECYKCKKLGHYRNECPEWEKEGNINYTEDDDDELMLLMAYTEDDCDDLMSLMACIEESDDELMLMMAGTEERDERKEQTWFLDSGCSNHMSGDKVSFVTLDESINKTVRLGNDMKIQVAGKGNVKVTMSGKAHLIQDVYYSRCVLHS